MPACAKSAPNAARPVTLSSPSGRIVRLPIHWLLDSLVTLVPPHALAASRTDPNEAIGKPAWATTRVAPTPRTTRRGGPRRGDPRGRPSRDPRGRPSRDRIAPDGRAVAHLESSTASFPSYEVACHALAASRTDPNEGIGKPAWATTRVAPTMGYRAASRLVGLRWNLASATKPAALWLTSCACVR